MITRKLNVLGQDYTINPHSVAALIADSLVYECGNAHDLHLDPIKKFNLLDVERLVQAVGTEFKS